MKMLFKTSLKLKSNKVISLLIFWSDITTNNLWWLKKKMKIKILKTVLSIVYIVNIYAVSDVKVRD